MENSREAAFSLWPIADQRGRRSERIDLLFMPPPLVALNNKGAISRRAAAHTSASVLRQAWSTRTI